MQKENGQNYPDSYYLATANLIDKKPSLIGTHETDVCVIGGGFTGLGCALRLVERGYKVKLLEQHRIGWGASGRNGGQLHSGQRRDQLWIERQIGLNKAREYWQLAEEAKDFVKSKISKHNIDCDWQDGLIHAIHKRRYITEEYEYAEHLQKAYGYSKLSPLSRSELANSIGTEKFFGGVKDAGGGHLHPLKFALGLAQVAIELGVEIFEDSRVNSLEQGKKVKVQLQNGEVVADNVVIATNGYSFGLNSELDKHVLPINNFIVATEPLSTNLVESLIPQREAVADTRFVVNYWRITKDNRMVFGGGETYSRRFPQDICNFVRPYLLKIYPQLQNVKVEYAWGGTLGITTNRMPFIKRTGNSVYIAAGFSGQGVALAGFAGQCLADAIAGENERLDLFSKISVPSFIGGNKLQTPILAVAMTWYAIRDWL